jgi:DNA (cytosine-5)-methyltransferase 1
MKKVTVGIFFTMCGSWCVALKKLGSEVMWHFMYSAKFHGINFHEVFSLNFPKIPVSDRWLNIHASVNLSVDLIVGSPPCVGISAANKKSCIDHPQNKRLIQFAETVNDLKPKGFIMEMTPSFPKPRFKALFEEYIRILSISYKFKWEIINFVDYGTPQIRKRFVIIGIKKDNPNEIVFPLPWLKRTPIFTVFKGLPELTAKEAVKQGLCWKFNPKWKGSWSTYVRRPEHFQLTWGGVAPCVTALDTVYFKHPDFNKSGYKRVITYREAARLMGFPDNFRFIGGFSKKIRQISWGVPCQGIQPFIEKLIGYL